MTQNAIVCKMQNDMKFKLLYYMKLRCIAFNGHESNEGFNLRPVKDMQCKMYVNMCWWLTTIYLMTGAQMVITYHSPLISCNKVDPVTSSNLLEDACYQYLGTDKVSSLSDK